MRALIAVALFSLTSFAPAARAEPRLSGPKADDIRKLLAMTGSAQLGTQVLAQVVLSMKRAMPHVPDRFWAEFQKEVKPDELTELLVPIYDGRLDTADVKALIAFYQTPTGKKFVSVLPAITQESMGAGETWGHMLTERAIAKLKGETKRAPQPEAKPR
jgi:hypothetical protein